MFVPDLNFVDKMTNLWQLGKEGTNKKYITINIQVVQQKTKKSRCSQHHWKLGGEMLFVDCHAVVDVKI